MSKPRIPGRKELAQWITQESDRQYPDDKEYGIGFNHYRDRHPVRWCGAKRALAHHGYSPNNDGWRQLVHDFCGLRTPTKAENNTLRIGRKLGPNKPRRTSFEIKGMEYVETVNARQTGNTYGYSLKCKRDERTEPVRMWDPYRSRSVLVPASTVYQVV